MTTSKGSGSKDLLEIADLEDECLIKLRDMAIENFKRNNVLLDSQQAYHQANKVERIHGALARSNVGPALLFQIERRNKQTGQILKDLEGLDDKLQNPEKYEL